MADVEHDDEFDLDEAAIDALMESGDDVAITGPSFLTAVAVTHGGTSGGPTRHLTPMPAVALSFSPSSTVSA